MRTIKIILRIILGGVFTFSGFVKAIDPLGFAYKQSDYFTEAFGLSPMEDLALILALTLTAFEFLVGISLLINIKPRLASLGALIFMVFFTPLTLYIAITDPVQDCGCFGEFLPVSNWSTFIKNLIFLPMSIYLFKWTKGERTTYKASIDWPLALVVLSLAYLFQLYTLKHLPIMDFRPYTEGTYIPEKMIIPEGEKPDSFATVLIKKHVPTGEIKEISEQTYMENEEYWDEEVWKTESTETKLVQKGYKPPIYNFSAIPINIESEQAEGEDVMDVLLADKNYSFFIIAYDMEKADFDGFNKMSKLIKYAHAKKITAHLLSSTTSGLAKYAAKIPFMFKYYNADPIMLKTVIRANPGLVLMKEGTIIKKWHYNDVPSIEEFEGIIGE